MHKIRISIFSTIFFLALFTGAKAQEIPNSIKILHNILTSDCGYEYNKKVTRASPKDVLVYTKYRSFVTVGFDGKGVRSGTVYFKDGCNIEKAVKALAAIYAILQIRMGKQLPDKHNAGLKGRRLLDTVTHNLKLLDKTKFFFDDLMVTAKKYPTDKAFSIRLIPW